MSSLKSKGIHFLPSLFTTGSMFCSFFSIIRSINGDYTAAAWAIFVASFFDMLDGRLARMTRTQSEFGREYDSLVDLASFGLAPSILVYTWTLSRFHSVGWFVAFLFFACAALRLARFNVRTSSVEKKRFQGLPSPPAACLVGSLVLFCQRLFGVGRVHAVGAIAPSVQGGLAVVLVPLLAVLMVSEIPYRSFKEYEVEKRNSFYVLIFAAVTVGVIAINPDVVLFLGFLAYAVSGPAGEIFLFWKGRKVRPPTQSTLGLRRRKISFLPVLGRDRPDAGLDRPADSIKKNEA